MVQATPDTARTRARRRVVIMGCFAWRAGSEIQEDVDRAGDDEERDRDEDSQRDFAKHGPHSEAPLALFAPVFDR